MQTQKYQRPPFETVLTEWRRVLGASGFEPECEWILDENLVFEKDSAAPTGVKLAYQTQFTMRPADLAQASYDFFTDYEARMVFYRLGSSRGKSICLLLCDPLFETRGPDQGFVRRDEWLISFYPGEKETIEEVTDAQRWKNRMMGGRPLNDVDFCLPLAVLRELEVHGRPLTANERFGMKVLDAWQRWQRASGE
ncbi:MAG: hypothetical protein RLY20_799 [Verrucomicrobiota bacterium]|jgi:hypothetical protein